MSDRPAPPASGVAIDPGWKLPRPSATAIGDPLSAWVFRLVVLTGVAAGACFLTTGFAPAMAGATITWGLLLAVLGGPVPPLGGAAQLGSVAFLAHGIQLWSRGSAGIVALTQFTCGVMSMQWVILTDAAAGRRALVLAGMIVLAVAAMSVNFLFPLALAPYVIFLLLTLAYLGDRPDEARVLVTSGRGPAGEGRFRPRGAVLGFGLRGGALFLTFWIGLFYLIPRPDVLGIASGAAKRRLRGFSETLRLGEAGGLEDNPMVVMRVQPVAFGDRHKRLLQLLQNTTLRGCSFVSYQKGSWSRIGYRTMGLNLRRTGGQVALAEFRDDPRPELELEILRENFEPAILFLPAHAVTLQSSIPFLWLDSDGTLGIPTPRGGVEAYHCRVKMGPPRVQDVALASAAFPAMTRRFADPGDSGGSIQDLAEEATRGCRTLHETVQAISTYLARNYTYSLEGEEANVRDPVSHFLMTRRSGNCEHFASSMVLMLRHLGIPARPVNGYLLTEWNEYGGFFTVRQRDAHTWAEVFFPGHGWVPFDPTPPRGPPEGSLLERWFGAVGLWERFEGLWFNFVYRFDRDIQVAGFRKLYQSIARLGEGVLGGGWAAVLVLAGAVGAILVARRRAGARAADAAAWLPGWYRAWSGSLPLERAAWETPREFHRRLLAEGLWPPEAAATLGALEREVARGVFGGDPAGAAERSRPLLDALRGSQARLQSPG